jgi:hypothetical protein
LHFLSQLIFPTFLVPVVILFLLLAVFTARRPSVPLTRPTKEKHVKSVWLANDDGHRWVVPPTPSSPSPSSVRTR